MHLSAPETDTFQIEGHPVHLTFVDDGLVEVALERTASVPPPAGQIGVFLAAVGEPEAGPAFQTAAALAGTTHRRWAASSGSVADSSPSTVVSRCRCRTTT